MRHRSMQTWAWLGAVTLVFLLGASTWPVHAQSAIAVVENAHEHVFKESITFRLAAKSAAEIAEVRLFYRVSGQTSANKVVLEFDPGTEVQVEHVEDMADDENYQPPMITFTYWWVIVDQDGNRLKTDLTSFVYEDTRYTWQVLEDDLVRLYWHDQDQAFGQGYFDRAVQAAGSLSAEFDVVPEDQVAMVIYNSHQELMSVLQEASAEWTGAVNFGDKGCIAIGLGSTAWMEKVIPHELTHAMLDQITKPPFGDIPRWLHEGLAVRSEGEMSLEERAALADAIRDDDLISLRVLNSAFADQRDRAILSYAESYSLIDYIIAEYGTEKLGELIAVFAEGAHYDDAMMQIFGVDMDGMEDLWREYIGAPPRQGVTRATPVPTVSPSPTQTPQIIASSTPPPPATATVVAVLPTATAVAVLPTATATISRPQQTATPTPTPAASAPCLGAIPAIALLALFAVFAPRRAG